MKRPWIVAAAAALLPCQTACAHSAGEARAEARTAGASNGSKEVSDFVARLARIKARVGDLTFAGELLGDAEFTEVHAQPQGHLQAALAALRSPETGETEKMIAALAMQRLPLAGLVRLAEEALALLEAGRVSETVFERAVFPTYDWSTSLVEAWDDAAVQPLWRRVLASPAVGARRKEIVEREILTGNARRDVLELREAGEIN